MLKSGQRLGQYKIIKRIDSGGFADVYQAKDLVEGISVALKIPHADNIGEQQLEDFRREVRLAAKLDHPNILLIKHAGFIEDRLVIVYPLGKGNLENRLGRRMSVERALGFAEQMLEAVACAHRHKILHQDIKPDNFILFAGDRMRLADFGLARVARYTIEGSGSGTVGYIAPEQAMGKPTLRSDVFSLGLIMWRMFSGALPEWPFKKPLPGHAVLRRALPSAFLDFLLKAIEIDQPRRYKDAAQMLAAFKRVRPKAKQRAGIVRGQRRRKKKSGLLEMRFKIFNGRYAKELQARESCTHCQGPVSEAMLACPWCGVSRRKNPLESSMPATCGRCKRGRKLDWRFCAWCYGAGFKKVAERRYSDARYAARCSSCREHVLLPFARYCPQCRAKVKRPWKIAKETAKCKACRWGVLPELWKKCPWCTRPLH
jgi:hypothetical protein